MVDNVATLCVSDIVPGVVASVAMDLFKLDFNFWSQSCIFILLIITPSSFLKILSPRLFLGNPIFCSFLVNLTVFYPLLDNKIDSRFDILSSLCLKTSCCFSLVLLILEVRVAFREISFFSSEAASLIIGLY